MGDAPDEGSDGLAPDEIDLLMKLVDAVVDCGVTHVEYDGRRYMVGCNRTSGFVSVNATYPELTEEISGPHSIVFNYMLVGGGRVEPMSGTDLSLVKAFLNCYNIVVL